MAIKIWRAKDQHINNGRPFAVSSMPFKKQYNILAHFKGAKLQELQNLRKLRELRNYTYLEAIF